MDKFYIGYVKAEPHRADVIRIDDGAHLLGKEGGYDSYDGPFDTKEEAEEAAKDA